MAPQRQIWKVSELTERIRDLLEGHFGDVWVEGEVSNCRAGAIRAPLFHIEGRASADSLRMFPRPGARLKFRPEDGLHVTVRGSLGVYELRGEYQIYVSYIEPVGLGALQLAFEQLKKKLEAEGLFDEARKKPLPVLPRCIGVVTSPTGAAIRDILRVLKRRFANVHVQIYPVKVQGDGAAAEIAAALRYFNRAKFADVLIVARGGGSLEDLWAFNEEAVARAIAESEIPVITRRRPRNGFHDRRFRRGPARSHAFRRGGNRGALARRIRAAHRRAPAPHRAAHALLDFRVAASRSRSGNASRLPPARNSGAAAPSAGGRTWSALAHRAAPAARHRAPAADASGRANFVV